MYMIMEGDVVSYPFPPMERDMAADRVLSVEAFRIFYFHDGRNAWYNTWVSRYPEESAFCFTLGDATRRVEDRRVQGSTFCIAALPACMFRATGHALAITEINANTPLSLFKRREFCKATLAEVAKAFAPRQPNTVMRLITGPGTVVDRFAPAVSYGSRSVGSSYPLSWAELPDRPFRTNAIEAITDRYGKWLKSQRRREARQRRSQAGR